MGHITPVPVPAGTSAGPLARLNYSHAQAVLTLTTGPSEVAALTGGPGTGTFDLGPFTVPASGLVDVELQFSGKNVTLNAVISFALYDVGAAALIAGSWDTGMQVDVSTDGYRSLFYKTTVSLTPGATKTLRPYAQCGTAGPSLLISDGAAGNGGKTFGRVYAG